MKKTINNITFEYEGIYNVEITEKCVSDDYAKLGIRIDMPTKTNPEKTAIRWDIPVSDIFSQWNPMLWFDNAVAPQWENTKCASRSALGAPVQTHISADGENRITVALADVKTPCEIYSGISEEKATISYKLVFFTEMIAPIDSYETEMIVDTRKIPFYDAVCDVSKYWDSLGYKSAYIPENAQMPMYSTWYSMHQILESEDLINELKIAKEYGMDTVITDDGWQTDNNDRGYAYCGDWEVAESKIPDMKNLVDRVHALGMKYMMWYSVPFVGIHSKAYEKFKGKYLNPRSNDDWYVLDPRYPEVRQYLCDVYTSAVKNWGLDGLKLDFIDSFALTEETAAVKDGMDFESLEDSVCALLGETKKELIQINPDILIEFRQMYMGPIMRMFGNMIRVADCPYDPIRNRTGGLSLRMTSGSTAVHSDMIMWNTTDTVKNVAIQLANSIFNVYQISVRIENLPEDHKKVLKFYLDFARENKDCLLSGKLKLYNPEARFTLASSEKDGRLIAACYGKNILKTEKAYDHLTFINAGSEPELIVDSFDNSFDAEITIFNCMGDITAKYKTKIAEKLNPFDVELGGMIDIKKI